VQNLQIDALRLWDSLMHTAQIGGTPKGGCYYMPMKNFSGIARRAVSRVAQAAQAAPMTIAIVPIRWTVFYRMY